MLPAILLGLATYFTSCKEDEVFPAPVITLSAVSASNIPGQKVTTKITIDAPAGGQTLNILVNGAASAELPNVDLAGEVTTEKDIDFTIPTTAAAGATYVINFQVVDVKEQRSDLAAFTVTVTAVPNKPIIDVTGSITVNTTWTADKIYRLKGFVRVGTDAIA